MAVLRCLQCGLKWQSIDNGTGIDIDIGIGVDNGLGYELPLPIRSVFKLQRE